MSSMEEDMRKALNKAPFASPFVETFDSSTDSLEAIRDAINGIEAGIYTYAAKSGPDNVEINDEAEFSMELLNPGDIIIPDTAITAGNYKIDKIRDGTLTNVVAETGASKAAGRIYCTEKFETASGWAVGDLFKITFSGGGVTIGDTTTALPTAYFYGRIVREEEIISKVSSLAIEFTAQPAQPTTGTLTADPTEVDDSGTSTATAYGDAAVVKSYEITPDLDGVTKYVYADLTWKVANGVNPRSKWMVCAGDTFVFASAVDLTDELVGAGTFHRSGQIKLGAMDNIPFTIALLTIVDSGTADVDVVSTTELRVSMTLT